MKNLIYLDGFATLPLAPEVRSTIFDVWQEPGNAGAPNRSGDRAAEFAFIGRTQVADLIGAAASEIIFTSGATEANNLVLLGVADALVRLNSGRRRIVISAIEHKAVLEPAKVLAAQGFHVDFAPVSPDGQLDIEAYLSLMGPDLLLASVMLVNNETGVIQPVHEAASLAHSSGAYFHCDAAQAAGKIAIDIAELGIDYLSLSAHKCYGPMGIGALYIAAGAPKPMPLTFGGGQQQGIRPGTEPVALIAGFGAAAHIAADRLEADQIHALRSIEQLLAALHQRQLRFTSITGNAPVVPGTAALHFPGIDAEQLCAFVAPHVSISTGSACTSGQLSMSHVLDAMGFSPEYAKGVVRFFCHRYLDETAILAAAGHIADAAERSRLATGDIRQ